MMTSNIYLKLFLLLFLSLNSAITLYADGDEREKLLKAHVEQTTLKLKERVASNLLKIKNGDMVEVNYILDEITFISEEARTRINSVLQSYQSIFSYGGTIENGGSLYVVITAGPKIIENSSDNSLDKYKQQVQQEAKMFFDRVNKSFWGLVEKDSEEHKKRINYLKSGRKDALLIFYLNEIEVFYNTTPTPITGYYFGKSLECGSFFQGFKTTQRGEAPDSRDDFIKFITYGYMDDLLRFQGIELPNAIFDKAYLPFFEDWILQYRNKNQFNRKIHYWINSRNCTRAAITILNDPSNVYQSTNHSKFKNFFKYVGSLTNKEFTLEGYNWLKERIDMFDGNKVVYSKIELTPKEPDSDGRLDIIVEGAGDTEDGAKTERYVLMNLSISYGDDYIKKVNEFWSIFPGNFDDPDIQDLFDLFGDSPFSKLASNNYSKEDEDTQKTISIWTGWDDPPTGLIEMEGGELRRTPNTELFKDHPILKTKKYILFFEDLEMRRLGFYMLDEDYDKYTDSGKKIIPEYLYYPWGIYDQDNKKVVQMDVDKIKYEVAKTGNYKHFKKK